MIQRCICACDDTSFTSLIELQIRLSWQQILFAEGAERFLRTDTRILALISLVSVSRFDSFMAANCLVQPAYPTRWANSKLTLPSSPESHCSSCRSKQLRCTGDWINLGSLATAAGHSAEPEKLRCR